MKRPLIIAEIGCNHQGEFAIAQQMVRICSDHCRVDVVKFQKRNVDGMDDRTTPHPNPAFAFGATYYEHRKALEFDAEQHLHLARACHIMGVQYACSVFDVQSVLDIVPIHPAYIKIGSGTNHHTDVIDAVAKEWPGEIHVSVGMTKPDEIDAMVHYFLNMNRGKDLVLYACTTSYPCAPGDACLLEITRLHTIFGRFIKSVGFSGHHQGVAIDLAAQTLGASHIERHITLNRTWKGTDHAASLEPDGMRKLVKYVDDVAAALEYKTGGILECERGARNKYKPQTCGV